MTQIFSLAIMTYLKRLFENCHLKSVSTFWSLTLHAVNFLLWKKIITVSRPTTFKIFLMGRSGCPTKQGTGKGGFPCKPKSLYFPLLLIKISHFGKSHVSGNKVSLLAFRHVVAKILPAACIQLHNFDLFEKARLKLSLITQNSAQHDYLPESYARYLPS